ncbi:MAG: MFS transporter [Eggerthellaceae bacterium]|nr:MFS transporter [Eggerthellaceae bacterium]
MMENSSQNAKGKLHFGYLVVAAMVLTSFIPLSLGLSCAGIFYPALSDYLGVERGMLSYYTSVLWIAALVTLPFLGKLLNNKDARLCLTGAVVIIAAAFVWLSFTQALWMFYVAAAAMGVGVAMLLFLAPSTLINRWFAKRAGFLLGIVMAFTGIGGVVWSTVGGILIQEIGWSATYLVFAVLSACTIPVTLFMVASRPEDKGLQPHGWDPKQAEVVPKFATGIAAHEAFKMPVFYLICLMCFLLNIGMYVYFMIPSYATTLDIGVAFPLLGATASSVAMAGQTVSKLALGAVGEKRTQTSTIVALALGIAGVALLAFATGSTVAFYAAALCFGVYYGITNVMMPIFTRKSFGDRDYAQIYSRVSMVASISNAAAAFIWGTVIDATHSYMPMFIGVIALMAATIVTVVAIGRMQARRSA